MNENDAYIEHLENTIKDLQNQVSNLTEMVLLLRKEKFGSSSEKTPKQIDGQLSYAAQLRYPGIFPQREMPVGFGGGRDGDGGS